MPIKPDRLYISAKFAKTVEEARKHDGYFKGLENKDFFLLALLLGVAKKSKVPLIEKEGFVRDSYLNDNDKMLLQAVAVADVGEASVLANPSEIFSIAERYANGGGEYFRAMLFEDPGSFTKKFSALLKNCAK